MAPALDADRLARLDEVMAAHTDPTGAAGPPGAAWLVARRGQVHVGVAGTHDLGTGAPVAPDGIFRLSSLTKPLTAVAALVLVEECRVRLDDPVDPYLPELADRRVLARPDGPLHDTVPAARPITLRDLLTFRLGLGLDFTATSQPVLDALAERGLPAGPPAPAHTPGPEQWMARLGAVPLEHQPGEQWRYHVGAQVLGVLVARVAGQPFDTVLRERVLAPLGMHDTGFWVPPPSLPRFGPVYAGAQPDGVPEVYDPTEGQWASPPAFPDGADGLVSTVGDLAAFGHMLLRGGVGSDGHRVLGRASVAVMTTNHLTPVQVAGSGPDPSGAQGWGFGVGVQLRRDDPTPSVGSYGWAGGLGSSWTNDPAEDLVGVLLTNQMWTSPGTPSEHRDFWTAAYAALGD